jgi:hypothetical protein
MTEDEVIATEGEGYTRDRAGGLLYSRQDGREMGTLTYKCGSCCRAIPWHPLPFGDPGAAGSPCASDAMIET